MIDNPYLDTIISLVLIYGALSVLVSIAVEWWNDRLKERGRFLRENIERMVNDPFNQPYGNLIYQHPLIARLQRTARRLPAYISAQSFATAFMDVVAERAPATEVALGARFKAALGQWKTGPLKEHLLGAVDRCTDSATGALDLNKLRTELMQWYDDHMDRATGAYKDRQRWKLYIVGFTIALALNADSIHLAHTIFLDEPLRRELVIKAERAAVAYSSMPDSLRQNIAVLQQLVADLERDTLKTATAIAGQEHLIATSNSGEIRDRLRLALDSLRYRMSQDRKAINKLVHGLGLQQNVTRLDSASAALERWGLPIGWATDQPPCVWLLDSASALANSGIAAKEPLFSYYAKRNRGEWKNPYVLLWFLGVVLTGLAISLGAPFWFETLVKLINIRRAGVKPVTPNEK